MSVNYFAITDVGGDNANPEALIRMVRDASGLSPEYWDRHANRWIFEPELLRYTFKGEVGAEEVTEEQARAIITIWREGADGPPA